MQKLLLFLLFLVTIALPAQTVSNTLELKEEDDSPSATLDDINWIEGHWRGEAFGGIAEEIWSPPLGESMMGSFKLVQDDKIKFYEIMTIAEVNQTLVMRLKHFDSELKGWEEKDETVNFRLVRVTPDKVFFDGLTFEKISEKQINVYVILESQGERSEGKFEYFSVKP